MMKLILILKLPVLALFVISIVSIIFFADESYANESVVFDFLRILIYCYVGWISYERFSKSILLISSFGAIVFFIDHVLFKGGYFLLEGLLEFSDLASSLNTFFGVLVSFFLLTPIAVLLVGVGAFLKRINNQIKNRK